MSSPERLRLAWYFDADNCSSPHGGGKHALPFIITGTLPGRRRGSRSRPSGIDGAFLAREQHARALGRNWERCRPGRALVLEPEVLLLDNPLGGLRFAPCGLVAYFLGQLSAGNKTWSNGRPLTLVATAEDLRPGGTGPAISPFYKSNVHGARPARETGRP